MPYTATTWVDGTTVGNQTRMNNLETQYTEATNSFQHDLLTPFILSGGVATKDGSIANQLDVTTLYAYVRQADFTSRYRQQAATHFTTATPSTTYYLYIQPDGTWYWSTTNSPAANSLAICTVATDGSGNISSVTDARVLNTSLLSGMAGAVSLPNTQYVSKAGDTMTGALTAPAFHGPADSVLGGSGVNASDPYGWPMSSTSGRPLRTGSFFSGTGSGTVNHNMNGGQTPTAFLLNTNASGSQTYGYDTVTSTTVHITAGGSLAWTGISCKW